jgi:hypothetical protein
MAPITENAAPSNMKATRSLSPLESGATRVHLRRFHLLLQSHIPKATKNNGCTINCGQFGGFFSNQQSRSLEIAKLAMETLASLKPRTTSISVAFTEIIKITR